MTPPAAPVHRAPVAQVATAADDLGRAVVGALLAGLGLGLWCRASADGSGGLVGGVLADLGAPWTLTAFLVGAAVLGRRRSASAVDRSSGVVAGALAGAGALAVASWAYYGGASDPRAVLWIGIGLVVGGLAGGAGAAWAIWPRAGVGVLAATALGLSFTAEGLARVGGALGMGGSETAKLTVLAVIGLGVLAPPVLTRGSAAGFVGSLAVLALAVPTSALLVAGPGLLGLPAYL